MAYSGVGEPSAMNYLSFALKAECEINFCKVADECHPMDITLLEQPTPIKSLQIVICVMSAALLYVLLVIKSV